MTELNRDDDDIEKLKNLMSESYQWIIRQDIAVHQWIIAFASLASLLATVVIVFIYWNQLGQMTIATGAAKSAAETADTELKISSRAWMAPSIESSVFEVGKPLIVIVAFKNTGKTPAKKVRTCQVARLVNRDGKQIDISCPDSSLSPGYEVIFPEGKRERLGNAVGGNNLPPLTPDGMLTYPIAESLRLNRKSAITYGRVDYDDIFGIHHWATFCSIMLIMPPTPGGLPETHSWQSCQVGNDIDNN